MGSEREAKHEFVEKLRDQANLIGGNIATSLRDAADLIEILHNAVDKRENAHDEVSFALAQEKLRADNALKASDVFLRSLQGELTGAAPAAGSPVMAPCDLLMLVRVLAEKAGGRLTEECLWRDDGDGCWDTACGEAWSFVDGGPEENRMIFCHRCGKRIVIETEGDALDS